MRIFSGHEKSVYAIGITPDNTRLISVGRDDTIRCWELDTGVVQWQNRVFPAQAALAISPDGKYLATTCVSVGSVSLWDLKTGKRLREFAGGRDGTPAFSPDSTRLAAAFKQNFAMWDVTTGRAITWNADVQLGVQNCVAFTPDGGKLIGGAAQFIAIWNERPPQLLQVLHGLHGRATHLSLSPDGSRVCAISRKHLCVWEMKSGALIWEELLEGSHFQSTTFSPNHRLLATAGNTSTVCFYDTQRWTLQAEYTWRIGKVLDVTFAPDGLRAAAAGSSGKIVVWDVDE